MPTAVITASPVKYVSRPNGFRPIIAKPAPGQIHARRRASLRKAKTSWSGDGEVLKGPSFSSGACARGEVKLPSESGAEAFDGNSTEEPMLPIVQPAAAFFFGG